MLGVSFWPYDAASIKKREYTGKTEKKFLQEWNNLLSERFHLNITLPGAFIDSYAKQPWNLDDNGQQTAFSRETNKLWLFSKGNDLFMFRTVEDVLKENQKLKDDIRCLNDTLSNDIADLKNGLSQLNGSLVETKNGLSHLNGSLVETKSSVHDLEIDNDNTKMNLNVVQKVKTTLRKSSKLK